MESYVIRNINRTNNSTHNLLNAPYIKKRTSLEIQNLLYRNNETSDYMALNLFDHKQSNPILASDENEEEKSRT